MADVTSPTLTPRVPAELSHNGPIGLFDQQLKILGDSYITFFQDRIRIEETYVENLRRLHAKAKTIDGYLDDRASQASTARQAWREIRESVEREADARYAFIAMLTSEVTQPLLQLRETQERTKKRIREDIRESTLQHLDFAEQNLPRLKRTYMKRCQEADEHRAASREAPPQLQNNAALQPGNSAPPQRSHTVSMGSPTRLGARPSQVPQRNRSPSSAGGALADLAQQGKKGLNQLKGLLDGKATNGPPGRTESALKGVRAKRDADEADQEYRKAVHWLETLRLNRIKIIEGGYNSLETFVFESTQIVRRSLTIYVDNLLALSKTNSNFAEHNATLVPKISAEKDTERIRQLNATSKALAIPQRVLYENAYVGLCPDLSFGVALVDYARSRNLHDGEIPRLVHLCIAEIERRGLGVEGIYRISGRHAAVQELVHKIERDERAFAFDPHTEDVHCVSSLLKQYLRQLPEPVFRFPLAERMHHTEEREEHASKGFAVLRSKIRRLPPVHQSTLKAVLEHLSNVASHVNQNKMDVKNLAIVFGAVIFGEDEMPKGGDVMSLQPWKDTVMEDLIIYARDLFDHPTRTSPSPPLPPVPSGESEQVPYTYGSAYTPASVSAPGHQQLLEPPRPWDAATATSTESLSSAPGNPAPLPAGTPPQPSSPTEDFAPQFNQQPPHSIHPGRRHGKTPSATSSRVGSTTALNETDTGDTSFVSDVTESDTTPRAEIVLHVSGVPSTLTGPQVDDVRPDSRQRVDSRSRE